MAVAMRIVRNGPPQAMQSHFTIMPGRSARSTGLMILAPF
jgi:hypothetical protein